MPISLQFPLPQGSADEMGARWETHGSYMGGTWELLWTYRGATCQQASWLQEKEEVKWKKSRFSSKQRHAIQQVC